MAMNKIFNIYMEAEKFSPASVETYTDHINRFLDFVNKPEDAVTFDDVMEWKKSLSNYASATIAQHITCVKTYFKVLNKYEVIHNNNVDKLDAPSVQNKPKHYMSADMVKDMVKACEQTRDKARNKAIVLLYCSAGPRVSELTGLTLEQYQNMRANGENQVVITGKGRKQRKLTFNRESCMAIDEYLCYRNDHGTGCDKLFLSEQGNMIARNNMNCTLKSIARKAGITWADEMSNHCLRAACATIYADNNVPIAYIRDIMGHSDITTTSRYIKRNDNAVESTVMGMSFMA